jgi:uncharacterized protein YdhG (YjbR/CyaY superfamily)
MLSQKKPTNVTEYINGAPKEARKKLREIRACVRKATPGATESLKWGMPAYSYRRMLVAFAGYKHHIGFYPTPGAVKEFARASCVDLLPQMRPSSSLSTNPYPWP